jgi:hypothetical protein
VQTQQAEDSRTMSKQQKTTERYLAKRQMLLTRKDECNRNIRDLGVLPEEAFEKYVNDKLERVRLSFFAPSFLSSFHRLNAPFLCLARQEIARRQRRPEEVRARE